MLVGLMAAAGCGGGFDRGYQLTGKVLGPDGMPFKWDKLKESLLVSFQSTSKEYSVSGAVDAEGNLTVYGPKKNGIAPDGYVVVVKNESYPGDPKVVAKFRSRIGDEFGDRKTSPLKFTMPEADTQVTIDLKARKVIVGNAPAK